MNNLFDQSAKGAKDRREDIRRAADRRVIAIRGAREHNLKNVDLDIPRDQLVVFTGLSGSGKSSLAFDTIYAEGQRRYVESLSAYARQFLEMMQKPDVDQIDGPVAGHLHRAEDHLAQSALHGRHRHRDLRLHAAAVGARRRALFAGDRPADREPDRLADGRPHHGAAGRHAALSAGAGGARPQGRIPQGTRRLQKKGFQRVKIDGKFYEIADVPALDKKFTHDIDVVVDRIVVRPDIATRLADSLETALKLADGLAVAEFADARGLHPSRAGGTRAQVRTSSRGGRSPHLTRPAGPLQGRGARARQANRQRNETAERLVFSEKFACPVSGFTIPEIEPRLFSFNNPFGACPKCGGLGVEQHIDADLVIPDKERTLAQGRHRAVGEIVVALLRADAAPRSASTTSSRSTPSGRTCRRRPRTPSSTAPATPRSASPTTTACAPTRPSGRSKASSPIWSAASARPTATGRARRSPAISPTCRARPARAIGSSPKRCA